MTSVLQQFMSSNQVSLLLTSTTGPLQDISDKFASNFKDACSVYEAASKLSEHLIDQLDLSDLQRYIALYLLLTVYDEPAENHPFIWTLLEISANTCQPLQRKIIADILVRNKRDYYGEWILEKYTQEIQKQIELEEEDQGIRNIRSHVQAKFKQFQMLVDVRKQTNNSNQETTIQFIRPFPQFMKISESELHWLSPGIISDVEWDNTADIDRKLQKSRKIFNAALDKQLDPAERQELLSSIQSDPHCPLHIGLKPQFLAPLISNNPYIAAALVIKVAKYSVMQDYLEQFLRIPTNILLFDTMARIVKQIRIPQTYIIVFCTHHMENVIKAAGEIEEKRPLILTMAAFMQCMFENYIIGPLEVKSELRRFMEEFNQVSDFGYFKQHLDKIAN